MSDFNKVFISGRIVRDAEYMLTDKNLAVTNFSIAVGQSKKNESGNWEDFAYFFDLSLYGNRATSLYKYLVKGQMIAIEAHLVQKKWEKDGKKFQRMDLAVDNCNLIGGAPKSHSLSVSEASEEQESYPEFNDADIPFYEDDIKTGIN